MGSDEAPKPLRGAAAGMAPRAAARQRRGNAPLRRAQRGMALEKIIASASSLFTRNAPQCWLPRRRLPGSSGDEFVAAVLLETFRRGTDAVDLKTSLLFALSRVRVDAATALQRAWRARIRRVVAARHIWSPVHGERQRVREETLEVAKLAAPVPPMERCGLSAGWAKDLYDGFLADLGQASTAQRNRQSSGSRQASRTPRGPARAASERPPRMHTPRSHRGGNEVEGVCAVQSCDSSRSGAMVPRDAIIPLGELRRGECAVIMMEPKRPPEMAAPRGAEVIGDAGRSDVAAVSLPPVATPTPPPPVRGPPRSRSSSALRRLEERQAGRSQPHDLGAMVL